MKKINRILTLLGVLIMILGLTACGGSGGSNGESADSGEQVNDNPYNLDYESSELQPMSDERADKETLLETQNDFFQGLTIFTGTDLTKMTYEDVVKHIGVDPSAYQYSYGRRIYIWYVEDSNGPCLLVYFDGDGSLYGCGSTNLS